MPMPSRRASRTARSTIPLLVLGNSCPSWWHRWRRGTLRILPGIDAWLSTLYRSQGHLLEVTDLVEKMQRVPGGLFPIFSEVMHQGKAYAIPQSVSPSPLVTRLDLLDAAKVEPPKTWDEFIEVCKKLQQPPKLTGYGMCLGLTGDTNGNVMNIIWSYGGKLVEADNKTVALHSPGTVKAVQLIADMYHKHKIIPKGAIGWDNTGNNKAYQSRQVIFVQNATSIYAHLAESDKELYNVTGLLPMPAGPAGAFETLGTHVLDALQAQPLSRGGQGAGRVLDGPGEPAGDDRGRGWTLGATVQGHVRFRLLEAAGVHALAPDAGARSALRLPRHGASRRRRGVASTYVIGRMMHRVLVENWEAEKAVEEAHKKVVEIYARHQEA